MEHNPIYIAHRGNYAGPDPQLENTPAYVEAAILLGFSVEVDIWGRDGQIWLGHDSPLYPVSPHFLKRMNEWLWCHCKNVEAIDIITQIVNSPNYFFHNTDDYTLTSHGYVWAFPQKPLPKNVQSVVVMPETFLSVPAIWQYGQDNKVYGICSDYVNDIRLA